MGKELEFRTIGPGEIADLIRELDQRVEAMANPETKYNFQVGIKDVEFGIDQDRAKALRLTLPFQNIDQAEQALRERVIQPTTFLEDDETQHQVVVFDPQPVGFSGFADCVTHSLAQTDLGLFEVGRYPAMNLASRNRYWQWFLHRRLATSGQVAAWQEKHHLSPQQAVECIYEAMTGGSRRM